MTTQSDRRACGVLRVTVCALLLMALCCTAALAAFKADVYSSSMKVYSRAKASSSYYLGSLNRGTTVTVEAHSGDWAKITYKGRTGYAQIKDMKSHKRTAMYTNRSVTVYQSASSSSKSLGKLPVNSVVYSVGWSGSYYLVEDKSGDNTGYIRKSHLSGSYTPQKGYTNRATTVYKTASTSQKLMSVAINTPVIITGESGSYYKVTNSAGTATGYIRKTYISSKKTDVKQPEPDKKVKAYTNCECYVYKRASTASDKLGKLNINSLVYVIDETTYFYKVLSGDGKNTGYIRKGKLSAEKTVVPEPSSDESPGTYESSTSSTTMPASLKSTQSSSGSSRTAKIEHAIYWAQSKLGYKYSSKPNNETNFDCAGLCYHSYKSAGVSIPSSSYGCGYSDSYQTITDISQLKRGDIVCFNTVDSDTDLSDHTGIYLGSGYFIHASSGANMVVVTTLNSDYYQERFFCGRRILE